MFTIVECPSHTSTWTTVVSLLRGQPKAILAKTLFKIILRDFIPSDRQFLDPVHNFLRSSCIEVFVCGSDNSGRKGRKIKGQKEGQVGLRCAYCRDVPRSERANQAASYPSKTVHIFESVRNYQRIHIEACEYIPQNPKFSTESWCPKLRLGERL